MASVKNAFSLSIVHKSRSSNNDNGQTVTMIMIDYKSVPLMKVLFIIMITIQTDIT